MSTDPRRGRGFQPSDVRDSLGAVLHELAKSRLLNAAKLKFEKLTRERRDAYLEENDKLLEAELAARKAAGYTGIYLDEEWLTGDAARLAHEGNTPERKALFAAMHQLMDRCDRLGPAAQHALENARSCYEVLVSGDNTLTHRPTVYVSGKLEDHERCDALAEKLARLGWSNATVWASNGFHVLEQKRQLLDANDKPGLAELERFWGVKNKHDIGVCDLFVLVISEGLHNSWINLGMALALGKQVLVLDEHDTGRFLYQQEKNVLRFTTEAGVIAAAEELLAAPSLPNED